MIHVLVLCKRDNSDVDKIQELYKTHQENAQTACIYYDSSVSESSSATKCCWQPLTEFNSTVINESNPRETNLKKAAGHVHSVADALPGAGCLLDVYVWLPDEWNSSDYVLLLGALRRLKNWHNARITVLDPDASPGTEFLQRFLAADVRLNALGCIPLGAVGCTPTDEGLLWRGKVCITDKIENKGLTVPGLSLHRTSSDTLDLMYPSRDHEKQLERAHLGRTFEVLDEISLVSVPSIYRTPHKYKLCLYQKPAVAQVLMNYIQESESKGLLARLAVYSGADNITTCAEIGLSTEAWKENIMTDIQYAQEPEEEFQDGYEFLYFLLVAPDKRSTPENFVATACLLQHPYHLSGNLATSIFHQSLISVKGNGAVSEKGDNCSAEDLDLSCLPSLNADIIKYIERDVLQLQRVKLQNWKDERQFNNQSTVMEKSELMALLASVRTQYLEQLKSRLPASTLSETAERVLNLKMEIYEACENSYEWPERLVQQYMESQRRALSRLQSSESMPLSSPVQHNDVGVTSVDIDSLLRCFHPDGSASLERMSPIRRRRTSRGHSKVSEPPAGNQPSTTWPECKELNTHDIYYNLDKKTEKINNHLNRFQEKYVKDETLSSCQSHVVLFPKSAKKTAKDSKASALRRSPRKQKPTDHRHSIDPPRRLSLDRPFEMPKGPHTALRDKENKRRYSTPAPMSLPGKQTKQTLASSSSRRQSDASSVVPQRVEKLRRESDANTSLSGGQGTESRSQRHKRRLQEIVDRVLADHGVTPGDPIFTSCSTKLFKVTKLFVMDLPNSRNLKEEMKKIAEGQVKQVIALDRQRQGAKAESGSRRR